MFRYLSFQVQGGARGSCSQQQGSFVREIEKNSARKNVAYNLYSQQSRAAPCVTLCWIEKCLFVLLLRMLCLQKSKNSNDYINQSRQKFQYDKCIVLFTWDVGLLHLILQGDTKLTGIVLIQGTGCLKTLNSLLLQRPALYFWKPLSLTRWPNRSRNSLKAGPPSSLLYMSSSVCWPALQYITPT